MFYKTNKSADIGAMMHSLIFTAQEAELNVLDYFIAVLANAEQVRKIPLIGKVKHLQLKPLLNIQFLDITSLLD